MLAGLALIVVLLTGFYLIGLAIMSLVVPAQASSFLLGFAGSAFTHYLELLLRMIVGGAFLQCAPDLLFPDIFALFGWVLIATTACLFVVPWQSHRRFAQRAVPHAIRQLKLVAVASLLFGGFVLASVIGGAI
jgi:hypothetical protein